MTSIASTDKASLQAKLKTIAIIPAHNEERTISRVIDELRKHAPGIDPVVVDDCSTDGTREISLAKGVPVISLPVNLGIGGAVQTGFKYALERGYDAAVQIDGDGQHDPSLIDLILTPLAEGRADVVIGSRYLRKSSYKTPLARRIGMIVFSFLTRLATGQRVTDTTSGFRAINRDVISFFCRSYASDFPDAESLVALKRAGFVITEVPVSMRSRRHGSSSTTTVKSLYYPFKVSLALFINLLRKQPPRT